MHQRSTSADRLSCTFSAVEGALSEFLSYLYSVSWMTALSLEFQCAKHLRPPWCPRWRSARSSSAGCLAWCPASPSALRSSPQVLSAAPDAGTWGTPDARHIRYYPSPLFSFPWFSVSAIMCIMTTCGCYCCGKLQSACRPAQSMPGRSGLAGSSQACCCAPLSGAQSRQRETS